MLILFLKRMLFKAFKNRLQFVKSFPKIIYYNFFYAGLDEYKAIVER